jgi:hypothetical protein
MFKKGYTIIFLLQGKFASRGAFGELTNILCKDSMLEYTKIKKSRTTYFCVTFWKQSATI